MKNVYITSASRTAVGSLGKSLKNVPSHDLGSKVIASVIDKSNVELIDNSLKLYISIVYK